MKSSHLLAGGCPLQGRHPGGQGSEADALAQPGRVGHRGGPGRQEVALHRRWLPGELLLGRKEYNFVYRNESSECETHAPQHFLETGQ